MTASVWRARLSEGWCPIDGHGRLELLDGPEHDGYGYCRPCILGWRLLSDNYPTPWPKCRVASADVVDRLWTTSDVPASRS